MTLGPLLFAAPLALIALAALPVIWLILRATPPAPQQAELPSLRLIESLDMREETPARTPWWILALRMLAAAALIIGLSQPIYAPGATPGERSADGPFLIVMDNGWLAAPRWSELRAASEAALSGAGRDTPVHLLLTAPQSINADPGERMSVREMDARLSALDPLPWASDRAGALDRLDASGLEPARIFWASDGTEPASARAFANALNERGALTIFAAPPNGPAAITGLSADAEGVELALRRVSGDTTASYFVSALTEDGSALATADAEFVGGDLETEARFALPAAALSRITRFAVTAAQGSSMVWLWDSQARSRRVGLVSGDPNAQPLLSDIHYVRQALAPFASITEGSIADLVAADPDAIILTDIGQIDPASLEDVTDWVEGGGALIRFAGPRLAAQGDGLVPAPLRRSSRAIGGALTWEDPQALGSFPETSPFAGLTPPEDVRVRQQVVARPTAELARQTWARLEDGSPLVTADSRGRGTLILFHVTAGPDWSDLSYSGVYVEMLRRAIAAGRGETIADGEGTYAPELVLDGYGRLEQPGSEAAPLDASAFAETDPSQTHPPGLYRGPAGTRALNVAAGAEPQINTSWPAGAALMGDAEARSVDLSGPLLALAALLIAVDLFVALAIAGRLPRFGRGSRRAAAALVMCICAGLVHVPVTDAQPAADRQSARNAAATKAAEAALEMRLAYIETGDAEADRVTRAGLEGLSTVLFRRTSVEPALPHAVNPETDALDVYPAIFLGLPPDPQPLSARAVSRLNSYLRNGGALFIDTRDGTNIGSENSFSELQDVLSGLDTPPLAPVPDDHVLTRSFYLLEGFPGRYQGRRLWIERSGASREERRGDGVSRLFVGDADYLAAWAIDERGRALFSVDGGDEAREMSRRFGVNLVMYVLTGNYKEDQVHIPALLERLGEGGNGGEPGSGRTGPGAPPDLDDLLRRDDTAPADRFQPEPDLDRR